MKFFLILPVFWPKLTKIPVGGCYRINQNCHPWSCLSRKLQMPVPLYEVKRTFPLNGTIKIRITIIMNISTRTLNRITTYNKDHTILVGTELEGIKKSECCIEYLEGLLSPNKGKKSEVGMLIGMDDGLLIKLRRFSGQGMCLDSSLVFV